MTSLSFAAQNSQSPAVVKALLKAKANLEATDSVKNWENNISVQFWEASSMGYLSLGSLIF